MYFNVMFYELNYLNTLNLNIIKTINFKNISTYVCLQVNLAFYIMDLEIKVIHFYYLDTRY